MTTQTETEIVEVLEEVVKFLKNQVDNFKHVPGHVPQSDVGGCSWSCGPKDKPQCLYQKTKSILTGLKNRDTFATLRQMIDPTAR